MSLHQRDQQPHQTRAPLDRWCRATNKGKCPTAVVKFEVYGKLPVGKKPSRSLTLTVRPWKVTEIQVGKACLPTTILHGGELLNFMGVHLERWLKPVCLMARYLQTWGTCQVGRPLGRLRWPRKAVGPFLSTSQRRSYLLGTNISHPKVLLKMIFLFPRWDMLVLRSFFKGCGMHWNGFVRNIYHEKDQKHDFISNLAWFFPPSHFVFMTDFFWVWLLQNSQHPLVLFGPIHDWTRVKRNFLAASRLTRWFILRGKKGKFRLESQKFC